MAKQPEQMEIIKNWAFSFTCLATWNSHVDLQSRCNIGTVGTHYVLKNDNQFQLETLTVRHCLAWTPDTSSEKGVERVWGITRKCLAEMALFLNPEKFCFQIFSMIDQTLPTILPRWHCFSLTPRLVATQYVTIPASWLCTAYHYCTIHIPARPHSCSSYQ